MKKLIILILIFISCNIFASGNLITSKPISYIYDVYKDNQKVDEKCITKYSFEEHVSFLCNICGEEFLFQLTNEICGY